MIFMKIHSNSLLSLVLCGSFFVAVVFFGTSHVRAATISDISFPIAELGSCADKNACKAYCSDTAHQSVCEQFAENHGLKTKSSNSEQMRNAVKDGGPGNCAVGQDDPQKSCRAYCDSTERMSECIAYGKSKGLLSGERLFEAEKVATALKNGAKLPEGCTNESSCKQVCENPSTIDQAKSCFAFGKAAGLLPHDFNESKAEKVFEAIKDGTAPFKSPKDFRQCEHPQDESILKKCVDFGVKSGMLSETQAAVIKKTGGKGPGGCVGEACRAYCEEHQKECFIFSKENGLITQEQESQMKQNTEQFKQNLGRAPEAVKSCLASAIGQEELDAIVSGATMPDRTLGEKMRICFDQGRPMIGGQNNHDPEDDQRNLPYDTRDSVQGDEVNKKLDPQQQNESRQFRGSSLEIMSASSSSVRPYENRPMTGGQNGPQGSQNIPPEVKECLIKIYGSDTLQKLLQAPVQGELANKIRECHGNFFDEDSSLKKEQDQRNQSYETQSGDRQSPHDSYMVPMKNNEQPRMNNFKEGEMMPPLPPGQMPPQGMDPRMMQNPPSLEKIPEGGVQ